SEENLLIRTMPASDIEVFVTARHLHGRTLGDIVENLGNSARGVYLRAWSRHGRQVPIAPGTRMYVGDVLNLVGVDQDVERVAARIGQIFRSDDRTDVTYLAG